MPINEDRKYVLALANASGSADRNGAILDMSGIEEVDIVVSVGVVAPGAVTRIRVDSDSDVAFGSPQEIDGASMDIEDDDDGQVFIIPIQNPPERYVRLVVDKDGANACEESAMYVQAGFHRSPQDSASTDEVNVDTIHQWPSVGTGASASPSVSVSLSPSLSVSSSESRSSSASTSPSSSVSLSPSASPSSSSSPSSSASVSESRSVSLSPSSSESRSASVSESRSVSLSPSASDSPSASPSLSPSASPSPS